MARVPQQAVYITEYSKRFSIIFLPYVDFPQMPELSIVPSISAPPYWFLKKWAFLHTIKCIHSGSFDKYIPLCSNHHNQNMEHFYSAQRFLCALVTQSYPSSWPKQPLGITTMKYGINFSFLEFWTNGIIQYVPFGIWFLSLVIQFLRFIQVACFYC